MGIVKRSDKKSFYGVLDSSGQVTFNLMQKFTEISTSKNPVEYSRQYVHEDFEQTDVIGYAPTVSVTFDQHTGDAVHSDIISIFDGEKLGSDAQREILIVDFTKPVEGKDGEFEARKRLFVVVPGSEGGDTDRYAYTAELRAKGAIQEGTATTTDGWKTCTFVEK